MQKSHVCVISLLAGGALTYFYLRQSGRLR